ncbi:hypothetical protein Pelo_8244 [Pelomyxa schiedti]|nr:hypothetical protein Pelo_8244 [Pelomyxa schiedti]
MRKGGGGWVGGSAVVETRRLIGVVACVDHADTLCSWFNDPAVSMFMDDPEEVVTLDVVKDWYRTPEDEDDVSLVFLCRDTKKCLGYGAVYSWKQNHTSQCIHVLDPPSVGQDQCPLEESDASATTSSAAAVNDNSQSCDVEHSCSCSYTAEFSFVVGDEVARGQGYGSEILGALCELAFSPSGPFKYLCCMIFLYQIRKQTKIYNSPSVKAVQRLGFQTMQVRNGAHTYAGQVYDLIDFELTKEEWMPNRDTSIRLLL